MTENKEMAERKQTVSEIFVGKVMNQFEAELGSGVAFSDYQKTLAQHLYIKTDTALKALEAKRNNNNPPIEWPNVNMNKLAIDAVHRISLGLDALMDNHIHVIPYLNGETKKYDVDLRIGYKGQDYIRRELALDTPLDIIYQLVYSNDFFNPLVRSRKTPFDDYEFEIQKPFDRGEILGGFGYIMYKDERKNKLVIVNKRKFDKARAASKSGMDFWGVNKYEEEMIYKTLVHRVTSQIQLDPKKINAPETYALINASPDDDALPEIAANANRQTIDIEPVAQEPQQPTEYNFEDLGEIEQQAPANAPY